MKQNHVYSVGQVNHYIKGMFSNDVLLSSLYVRGEVSNCKYHSSGHIYFSIKDASGTLSAVMFASYRKGLAFRMKDGDNVIVGGSVDVYERGGSYQLYAHEISLEGAGILYERFLQLKRELSDMGMFDPMYKQPIPKYAARIGVVTAPTGAAIRDIQNISHRRNPYVDIILYPALVQGDGAKDSIVRGIKTLDAMGLDVLIVGRGGGSLEDLWAFNEEEVAQAIFEAQTPIISAVGHETDTTIADYVADLRAPTPSAAAELAVFDYRQFTDTLASYASAMERSLERRLIDLKGQSRYYQVRLQSLSPMTSLNNERRRASDLEIQFEAALRSRLEVARRKAQSFEQLNALMERKIDAQHHRLALLIERMKGLNPIDQLKRGFSYVSDDSQRAVTSIAGIQPGEELLIHVTDGTIRTEVKETESNGR